MGQPRRHKPSRLIEVEGIGRHHFGWGQTRGILARLRLRPRDGPSLSTICNADVRASGGPMMVLSSRYHAFMVVD